MNGEEGNTDYLSLKSLLQQWKLTHLLQHFMAQNISVEVLKMMKTQHIFELLHNFTCGDRIRFEYELEKWRYSIGSPLQQARGTHIMPISTPIIMSPTTTNTTTTITPYKTTSNNAKNNRMSKSIETQTTSKDTYQTQNNEEFFNFQPQTQTQIQSQHQPQNQHHSTPSPPTLKEPSTSSASKQTTIYSPRMRVSTPPLIRDTHARGRPSADLMAQQMSIKLDAREILERCGPRGPELMKIYESNKRFRPVERVELINLFAHYFYEHSIHLPVKLSYELEKQILDIFPGERLKDYRTEKRGKIYIRLSNIKNNRRRAREAKAAFLRDLDKTTENINDGCNATTNDNPNEVFLEDAEMLEEENSDSFDKPLRIYVSDIKRETEDDEFQD